MFKKEYIFETRYAGVGRKAIIQFMNVYEIKYIQEFEMDRIRYTAKLSSREFNAFAEYLNDLAKGGIYPILLRA